MVTPLSWAEPVTLGVVLLYLGVQKHYFTDRFDHFIRSYVSLIPAAWFCENTVIRAYGFYAYADGWKVQIDQTPVMVVIIWPIVVLSAVSLAERIRRMVPIPETALVFALVVADAALMEAIATSTGLWSWTVRGPFGVPLVGFWGWGCFAVASVVMLRRTRDLRGWGRLVVLWAGSCVATHVLLLVSWWGCFRWIEWFPDNTMFAAVAVVFGLGLAAMAARTRRRLSVPVPELAARAVAAVYFFILLFVYNRENGALILFSCAFAPPYLALFTTSSDQG